MRSGSPWIFLAGLMVAVAGCAPEAEIDGAETEGSFDPSGGPTAEFDPARSVIPTPNNFIISTTTGKVTIPTQCGESDTAAALREGVLNQLNGFGTYRPILAATFSEPVDFDSVAGKVHLVPLQPAGAPVPVTLAPYTTLRYASPAPSCGAATPVNGIAIIPLAPLADNTNYGVAILRGVKTHDGADGTANGEEFDQSFTFALTTQEENPVAYADADGDGPDAHDVTKNNTPLDPFSTEDANGNGIGDDLESIVGINRLWVGQSSYIGPMTQVLGAIVNGTSTQPVSRKDILLAWTFKTQTVESPLDPTAPAGPASTLDTATANSTATQSINPSAPDAPTIMDAALCGAQMAAPGCGICDMNGANGLTAGQLPCFAVGAAVAGQIVAPRYQVLGPNPGAQLGQTTQVPGMFSDPVSPTQQGTENITYYLFVPDSTIFPQPTGGYPVVIFGHGITRSKSDAFAIASQLNSQGIAVIAIDWVAHGSRAVQILPAAACAPGVAQANLTPTANPACYQPLLTSDLGSTRDNVRQTVLDTLKLVEVIKSCDLDAANDCGSQMEALDSTKMGYIGQSLGSIIGSITTSASPDIKTIVLNVPAVSWMTVLEETDSLGIKCPLVDSLIESGVLQGNYWITVTSGGVMFNNTDALCLGNSWKGQPGYQVFANAARWVLDPAEGANFVDSLVADNKEVLVQEVIGDQVVPNEATAVLTALLGLTSAPAAINTGTAGASPDLLTNARTWLRYDSEAAGGANIYSHGSLLVPTNTTLQARGGTAQMQMDAVAFLANKLNN